MLYKKGEEQVKVILNELETWMEKKEYKSIGEFRGKLNYSKIPDPMVYERAQFMKYFSSYH
ncbi:MAG TPA: hypothetical protein VJ203_13320 [Bacteroidales bacterium]|nr:hypothetical protein [Bacteroidales bacterium]